MNEKAVTQQQLKDTAARVAHEVSSAAAQDLEAFDAAKADKLKAVNFTIPANGWAEDPEAADFALYYDHPAPGVTADDRASVVIAPSGQATAADCELCTTNETLANKIRLRTRTAPAEDIPAVYWLEKGRSN